MKKLKAVTLLVLAIAAVACLTACGSKSVNLNKYLTITTSGYDTLGKARASFDEDAFAADYGGKLKLTASGKEWAHWYDSDVEMLLDCISGSLDAKSGLANGDTITYSWNVDLADIDDMFSNVKIKYSDITYKVSGLEDIVTFDAFDGVSVTFSGMSPDASASLTVSNSRLDEYDYVLDKSSGLSNGDVVTVTIRDSTVDTLLEEKGVCPESMSKEFPVEGLAYYATSLDQIPQEGKDKLIAQAQDVFDSTTTSWDLDAARLDSLDYLGTYFLSRKEGVTSGSRNIIYLVYKVNTTAFDIDEDMNNADFQVNYYWYIRFSDGIILEDGTFSIDYTDYERPEFTSFFGVTSGDGFTVKTHYDDSGKRTSRTRYYSGFEDLDSMFNKLVTKKVDSYYYESTVVDS